MDPTRLWAKSKPDGEAERPSMLLSVHLRDVFDVSRRVLDVTADDQLRAFGLEAGVHRDRFRRIATMAAAVHDLGKANDHFQGMVLRRRDVRVHPQGLRHEWVTVLMLAELEPWLKPAVGSDGDWALVGWAVAGHHPAHNHDSPPRSCPPGAGPDIRFHTDRPDYRTALAWLKETFRLAGELPALPPGPHPLVGGNNLFQQLARWARDAQRTWGEMRREVEGRLLAAVKNTLIAADVAGSALPKEGPPDWERVEIALRTVPSPDDLQFLANYGLGGHKPRDFQNEVADHTDDVVFVKAGCGTGKTVAAYLRAARRWAGRRLYFCYPTTGTATEGFKDYLFPERPEKPDEDTPARRAERERLAKVNADLFHSRSGVDFEVILTTGGDTKRADADAADRADALAAWATPVAACTVDTVLGVVQNNRRGLFGWPALARSAFVFDEIHAYDDRLFGALLRFLRDLPGLPALLMTASLPAAREEALRAVLKDHRGIDLRPVEGPKNLEELPRYHKQSAPDNDPLPLIVAEVGRGGKVLWVSNTVSRVTTAADRAGKAGLTPLIYHSRFRYEDRVRRHEAVTSAFKAKATGGVLACTSQVCEMSLDLEGCTLLVTETAPVPALIQRLGRLNRHATPAPEGEPHPPTMPFLVIPLDPMDHLPYTPDDLAMATTWLGKLTDDGISQRQLASAWDQTTDNPPELVPSAWLDGGPRTTVTELREASPGVTILVASDADPIDRYLARVARERREARDQKRPFDKRLLQPGPDERHPRDVPRYTIPMPPPPKAVDWRSRTLAGIPVVPDETVIYDELRGAEWRKQ